MDIEAQKQEFIKRCKDNIHRDGVDDLLGWLQKSDFFTAPASTKYHGAYEGGLCEHSLDVYNLAIKTAKAYDLECARKPL